MKVLVTGATGFLGFHLATQLRARGDEVVALCRKEAPELGALGVTVMRGDILDEASVAKAAAGVTAVYHCAGKVSRDPKDAETLYELHVKGTGRVLDACKAAGVKRAVVASTSGVVAVSEKSDHIATEDDETPIDLIQRWPYYRSKLYAERAALTRNDADFSVICVNPTLLLGPGDTHDSSTEDVRLFLEGKVPMVPPGGLSFVDARDAATAMILAMDRGTPGERYLLGSCNLTLREFFGRLERASGVRAPVLPLPRMPDLIKQGMTKVDGLFKRFGLEAPVDAVSVDMAQYFWYLDASKAEQDLGWQPREPNATLADTVKDLRDRGVVWPREAS